MIYYCTPVGMWSILMSLAVCLSVSLYARVSRARITSPNFTKFSPSWCATHKVW